MGKELEPREMLRRAVRTMNPYVPGEQPKVPGLVKLNTNENPYGPSKRVLAAVKAAVDGRLRLYPDPTCDRLRAKLAALHECSVENIIVGNGSDELLALAARAFVEPREGGSRLAAQRSRVQFFEPSYSLYPVLAAIHDVKAAPYPLEPDFGLPSARELKRNPAWDRNCQLTFITTPNAPSGKGYKTEELCQVCAQQSRVVVLDEAYADFAEENAMRLALELPNVIVARTFSKGYSLCFQRVGYFVGHKDLIEGLHKIRDSYNVNGLGQVAAEAILDDRKYFQENFRKVIRTREQLAAALRELQFVVYPSQTNFLLVRPPEAPAERWLGALRDRKVLVRWFPAPGLSEYLRITVGTPEQSEALLKATRAILKELR